MPRQRKKYKRIQTLDVPAKANRVLHIILIAFVLIIVRIWHLAIIQHDQKLEESRRPQRRVVVEPAKRATIRDRYNIAMALNKVQYNATLLYSQMRHIPTAAWENKPDGTRVKRFKRKEYIAKLSDRLGKVLNLNPERIEDLIHAKGALYANAPFVVKEDITEEEYYSLKMMEKDWPGLQVQCTPKRHYPLGSVGADVIGYMGAINRQEYESVIREMAQLNLFLKEREEGEEPELPQGYASIGDVKKRLKDLQEHAYTLHDYVGKTGVEGRFEQDLRGFHGQTSFFADARGNFLRELPGAREPLAGERLLLTISSELQEFAEKLLAQNERIRKPRLTTKDKTRFVNMPEKQPWIKGGAIVAMDPQTGEVLALASYPRFDPNDFITSGHTAASMEKRDNIHRWFESERYMADIWDGRRPLERERYDDLLKAFFDEKIPMTWEAYLEFILPKDSPVRNHFGKYNRIKSAVDVQRIFDQLLELSGQSNAYALVNVLYKGGDHTPHNIKGTDSIREGIQDNLELHQKAVAPLKSKLDAYLTPLHHNYDKVLFVDLCRLLVNGDLFSDELLQDAGDQTHSHYRKITAASVPVYEAVKKMGRELFHDIDFKSWREANEKNFLKEKRAQEKAERRYTRPYLDYFDKQEEEMFEAFWQAHGMELVAALINPIGGHADPYLDYFDSLGTELHNGAHGALQWRPSYIILSEAVQELPQDSIIPYLKTLRSYQHLTRPTLGAYRGVRKESGQQLEKHLAAAFYPLNGCGYGRSQAYRQAATQGSIFKLVTAYEALVQVYSQAQGAKNPLEIIDKVYREGKDTYVGYTLDGKPIPRFYKGGLLPRSLNTNLGKMDLLRALETSSNPYFALLAGDVMKSPEDLAKAARLFSYGARTGIDLPAEIPGQVPEDLASNRTGLYATAIGQHSLVVTPLQTGVMLSAMTNGGKVLKPKIVGLKAGRLPNREEDLIYNPHEFPYRESLALAGIDFPLFTAVVRNQQLNQFKPVKTTVQRQVFMPAEVSRLLMEGMRRVVAKDHADAFVGLSRVYHEYPQALTDYKETKSSLLGKTSTSESMEQLHLDVNDGSALVNHVWFGGVAFDEKKQAELVVVVYLRYGGYGKAAAPVAAQMVKKWREIKRSHAKQTKEP